MHLFGLLPVLHQWRQKVCKIAAVTQVLFISAVIGIGKIVLKILKLLIGAIARSTWILSEAILRVMSLFSWKMLFISKKGRECSERQLLLSHFRFQSPYLPQSSLHFEAYPIYHSHGLIVGHLTSDPLCKSDTNVTAPEGGILTKPLEVLWCL